MDDSFAFRTAVPPRRQLDPRAVRACVLLGLVAVGIGFFTSWVMTSERESFAAADRRVSTSELSVMQIQASAPLGTDADAKQAARIALVAAEAAFTGHRSFLDAGPPQLTALQPGFSFVDGPSTAPRIVSVAATRRVWAAAVMGSAGSCYWIRTTDAGSVTRGTVSDCTGRIALNASANGW
jgi:hypothetical protein